MKWWKDETAQGCSQWKYKCRKRTRRTTAYLKIGYKRISDCFRNYIEDSIFLS